RLGVLRGRRRRRPWWHAQATAATYVRAGRSSGDAAGRTLGRGVGKALAIPLLHAALEVVRLEPAGPEHERRELAPVPRAAHHDDRLGGVELTRDARHDRVERDVHRALDPTRHPFV